LRGRLNSFYHSFSEGQTTTANIFHLVPEMDTGGHRDRFIIPIPGLDGTQGDGTQGQVHCPNYFSKSVY